jgi:hypothetical protein
MPTVSHAERVVYGIANGTMRPCQATIYDNTVQAVYAYRLLSLIVYTGSSMALQYEGSDRNYAPYEQDSAIILA